MSTEEISTIFVVGFPDDVSEREFTNMFLFAEGFEAAMLKSPDSDNYASFERANEVSKHQTLMGFAKFRSRQEAITAQQFLNGKVVDPERSCFLKVELAKKNLHTKRAIRREPLSSLRIDSVGESSDQRTLTPISSSSSLDIKDPQPAGDMQDRNWEMFVDDLTESVCDDTEFHWLSATPTKGQLDLAGAFRITPSKAAPGLVNYGSKSDRVQRSLDELLKCPVTRPTTVASAHVTPISTPTDPQFDSQVRSSLFSPFSTMTSSSMFSDKSSMTNSVSHSSVPVSATFPLAFRAPSTSFSSRRTTPAAVTTASLNGDHNPPCNTLYVGNLPPNTIEDELRQVFSSCPGYKRLCVRYKAGANPKAGPMCFVEFDTEDEAASAMNEKNGLLLSNSEKGGIRLSFSKNPLGVRRQPPNPIEVSSNPSTSSPMASATFRPGPLSALGGAPGLSFPGFSTPVTPISSQFKYLDRPLAPWG